MMELFDKLATLTDGLKPTPKRQTAKDLKTAESPVPENLTQPLVGKSKNLKKYLSLEGGYNGSANGGTSSRTLGTRLEMRKRLVKRRRWLVNVEFLMAMTGILLMMIDNEVYYADYTFKDSALSFIIKLAISVTTAILLIAICLYYQAGIVLRMFDGRVDDPFAVTPLSTWFSLVLELAICAVHPFPGNVQAYFMVVSGESSLSSVDGILSVLMMLRLYLVGKFIVVHSQLMSDPSLQSVAAVSHVKVNINFVLKAALHKHPAEVITGMILAMYVVSVWSMRTCELYYTVVPPEHSSFTEAMWLSAITFLTVGYGDLTPTTNCGRFIAVSTAMMGLCSTALLVAVIARKLEPTHQERYVHNFLMRVHLRNRFLGAAANVIKCVIKLMVVRKRATIPVTGLEMTVLRWRLTSAIRTMRGSRAAQAEVEEGSVGLTEVSQLLSTMEKRQRTSQHVQQELLEKMNDLKAQMNALTSRKGQDGDRS